MRFVADFHIHSHYSRATSPEMNVASLSRWAQIKGTNVIGTGDFTHPRWFEELREKLEPAEPGLFRLRKQHEDTIQKEVPARCRTPMRFFLSVEISTIYKRHERVRKVHSLIFAPSFEHAAKISVALGKVGNLRSDGRPILGLDTLELLKIVLDVSPDCMLVPAHVWTPHFAVFGSASGFDSLEEAFGDHAQYVYALETGLSSDPAMNWRLSVLDNKTFISNSDAHSARKLGREANVFDTELSYFSILDALKKNDTERFLYTVEFFPEEGKYHLDGHRECRVRLTPEETVAKNFLCPRCGKRLTVGVLHRVLKLADRKEGEKPERARPFKSIIPLPEIIAEVEGVGPASKRSDEKYFKLLNALGSEFFILLDAPLQDIETHSSPELAEAVAAVREGRVHLNPGYDGQYGTIEVLEERGKARQGP